MVGNDWYQKSVNAIKKRNLERPTINSKTLESLINYYKEDVKKLKEMSFMPDLSSWKEFHE